MNRIVFVSENKRKIEQITAILSSRDDMNLQLLSSLRFAEALSDIRAFKAELVIIDGLREGAGALFDEYVIYDDQLEQLFNKLAEYRIV